MTLQELLTNEPYLTTDEKQTGIYLVPNGKFGYTSFPVGEYKTVKVARKDMPGYVFPEGYPEEQRKAFEEELCELQQFELNENAVLVKVEDYELLMSRKKCWSNGKLIAYAKSKQVADAEILLASVEDARTELANAQRWLNKHDYIGVKIAEAFLIGDETLIAELKAQYNDVIAEAQTYRTAVNTYTKWLNDNKAAIQAAQEVLANEN